MSASAGIVGVLTAGGLAWAQQLPTIRTAEVVAPTAQTGVFYSTGPTRILDTRTGLGTSSSGPIGPDSFINLQVAGVGDVPANATAAAVTITVVGADSESFITVWPATDPRPGTSLLNPQPHLVLSQTANIGLGAGALSIYNAVGSTHAVVDLLGYFVNANDVPTLNGPAAFSADAGPAALPFGPGFSMLGTATLALPPGKWLVQAKGDTQIFGFSPQIDVRLEDTTANATLDTVSVAASRFPGPGTRTPFALGGTLSVAVPTTVEVQATALFGAPGTFNNVKIYATQISSINGG
jgi:hypothetical protein